MFFNTLSIACKIIDKPDSKNVTDAILVGISKNIEKLSSKSEQKINVLYGKVLEANEFSSEELKEGLGSKDKVKQRIRKSIEVFGND